MKDGIKIHVRGMKQFLSPNDKRITVRPTIEQMRQFNIQHFKGKQYRYLKFLCGKIEKRKLLRECEIDLSLPNPKDNDLSWRTKDLNTGKWVKSNKPPYIRDVDKTSKEIIKLKER